MGSAQSPAGSGNGQNADSSGGRAAQSQAGFASFLHAMDSDPASNESSISQPAQGSPDNSNVTANSDDAGQNNLSPDGGSATGQSGQADATVENDEQNQSSDGSQGTVGQTDESADPNAALTEALNGLDETQRGQMLEMLQDVKAGKANWGEIKRGHKANSGLVQQLESLRNEIESLKGGGNATSQRDEDTRPAAASAMPAEVARLRTVDEVRSLVDVLDSRIEFAEEFLHANPDGGLINGEQFTRAQIVEQKREWKKQKNAAPARIEQIREQATFTAQQSAAKRQIATDFPQLNDPEHPDTKVAREFLKDPRINGQVNGDYIALALATGDRVLKAELAARRGAPAGQRGAVGAAKAGANGARPQGKVPLGKPHTATGSAAARPAEGNLQAAMDAHRKEGSRLSFSKILSTSGR